MSDGKFVAYVTKLVHNPLLKRKQLIFGLIHPDQGSLSKTAIKEKLASMFKAEVGTISVFGIKAKFGGGRSTGYALIYDSEDARKKYDQKKLLRRDGLVTKSAVTRKQKKEMKGRMKKVRGTAKAKAAAASGKKKK